jgi:hypothetical protein
MSSKKALFWCACILGLISVAGRVQASTLGLDESPGAGSVLYSGSQLIQGNGASAVMLSLPSAGELFLTLTDLNFPDPFASLKFALTNAQTALVGLTDAGTMTFSAASPTTLYANVFATTQPTTDLGLYNLTVTFVAQVGLPATGGLLASVTLIAMALELVWRRRAQTTVTTAVA